MICHRSLSPLALLSVALSVSTAAAQQSYRSYQQLSGQVLRKAGRREQQLSHSLDRSMPMRFQGWNHPERFRPDYLKRFSRPHEWARRANLLANTAQAAAHANILGPQFAPSAPSELPGLLLRDSLPAGYIPTAVATVDLNGDGKMDFVVANGGDNTLWLYFGKGDGTFNLPIIVPITLGQTPLWVATGDLRGIGRTDLIVAESDSNSIGVFLNKGDGTFAESSIPLPGSAATLAIGDFNHDGKLDIAVPLNDENSSDYIVVFPGKGDGTFGSAIVTPAAPYGAPGVFWVSSADLNADGYPDLVVSESNIDYLAVRVFLNNGDGTFTGGQVIAQNGVTENLGTLLFDADEDGKLDALVTDGFGTLWFYHGNGDGTFSTNPNAFAIGDVPWGLATADVNGDGHMDVIASGIFINDLEAYGMEAGDQICVLEGDGKGNFGPPKVYRGDNSSYSLAIGDFNRDGHPDVVTANQYNDSASIFLNDGLGGFGAPEGNWVGYTGFGPVNAPMSGVVTADVDGNGATDITFMEFNQPPDNYYQLTVLLNDGKGNLSAPIRSDAVDSKYATFGDYMLADFRNTGHPDFLAIAANYTSYGEFISFLPNTGGGHFGAPMVTNPANAVGIIGVGDFNHDGKLDFVAAGYCGIPGDLQCIQIFDGNGDGTFQTGYYQTFGGTSSGVPVAVYVADFNRDGKLDFLVFTNYAVYEFLGKGDGTFQTGVLLFSQFGPMVVADVNGDGYPDIVEMVPPSNLDPVQFSIYLGQADGTFQLSSTYSPYGYGGFLPQAPYAPNVGEHYAPMVADFNGDGKLDIAAFQRDGNNNQDTFVQFLLGNGDGTFTPTYDIFDFLKPELAAYAVDLTGTGQPDLFELDGYRSTYSILQSVNAPAFQMALVDDPVPGNTGLAIIVLDIASPNSTTFSLSASDSAISVPQTITIPAGQISQTFSFTIGPGFKKSHVFSIAAQMGSVSAVAYGSVSQAGGAGFQGQAGGTLTWPNVNLAAGQSLSNLGAGAWSQGGYTTTLTFQCLNLSNIAQCLFTPPSVALRSNDFSNAQWQLSVPVGTTQGSYPAKVRVTDGTITQDFPFKLNVGDFTMGMSPAVQQVFPSGIAQYAVTLTSVYNYDGSVYLTCSGLPPGVSCPSPWIGNPSPSGAQYPLTLDMQNNQAGNYNLVITGNSTPLTHTASATLQIWDFNGSVSPTNATVNSGGSANFNITISSVNGFAGTVNLGCQPSSNRISCSFNPSSVSVPADGSATSVVTLTAKSQQAYTNQFGSRLTLACAIMLFPVTISFLSVATWQRRLLGIVISIMTLTVLLLSSCGGGSSGGGGGGGGGGTAYSVVIQTSSGDYGKNAGTITLTVE